MWSAGFTKILPEVRHSRGTGESNSRDLAKLRVAGALSGPPPTATDPRGSRKIRPETVEGGTPTSSQHPDDVVSAP